MHGRRLNVKLSHAARNAQRGQALIETIIFLPMFLFALFGMLWAVRIAVQSERVQSAIRYNWSISQRTNPYGSFSFYSMYSELGVTSLPPVTCTTPLVDPLSDAQPTYTSTASPPFFSPLATPTPSCLETGYLFYYAATRLNGSTDGSAEDLLVSLQEPTITSTVAVPSQLVSTIGSSSSTTSTAFLYQQVGLNVILACYPGFNTSLNQSLDIATDTSTAPSSPSSLEPIVYSTMIAQTEYQADYLNSNQPVSAACGYTAPP